MPVVSLAIDRHGRYWGYCVGTVERVTLTLVTLDTQSVSEHSGRRAASPRRE